MAVAGESNVKITTRAASIGEEWAPTAYPCEFLSLGGMGRGIPVCATITSFGPVLLSKVLGLNATQESSLGLVFHYADQNGLALLDLNDLREVIQNLTSDEVKADLKPLGGLSSATAGISLCELIGFADQGAEAFFGETEFDSAELVRLAPDGRGWSPSSRGRRSRTGPRSSRPSTCGCSPTSSTTCPRSGPRQPPAKALKAAVSTYPHSSYDLGALLTSLGTGEAVITVLSEKGAPTPVAWTRMRAPQSPMAPSSDAAMDAVVAVSPLARYAAVVDRELAFELLEARL